MISAMVQTIKYELTVAANAKSGESLAAKIEKALKEFSAEGVKLEKMGKRALAYPIAKQNEADFLIYNFEASGEAVNKLSAVLRLEQEAVLRYLILRVKEHKGRRVNGKKVVKAPEESKVEAKIPKVTVKTASSVVTTKVVAKKAEKAVKSSKIKKGKAKA